MKEWFWICLLSVALLNGQCQTSRPRTKFHSALELTADNYEQTLQANRIVLVEFYSPACPYCIQTAPEFDKVAEYFKDAFGVKIGVVDVSDKSQFVLKEQIKKYPTFRLFIEGQSVDYEDTPKAELMIEFLTEFQMARLLVTQKISDVKKPAVVVTGVDQKSAFSALPALFSRYPVYQSLQEAEFGVQILTQSTTTTYEGEQNLNTIAEWLQEQTAPVLVNMGISKIPKKLQKAMRKKWPILGVVNKGVDGSVGVALEILQAYCNASATDFVCGYLNKGDEDYDHLTEWINDPEVSRNRLVWIDMKTMKCYLDEGLVGELTIQSVSEFVEGVKSGTITEHIREFVPPVQSQQKVEKKVKVVEEKGQQL